MDKDKAIEVRNVSKSFKNKIQKTARGAKTEDSMKKSTSRKILDDISFCVKKGEGLGIIGTNGAGKSTLLKIMTGVMEPDSGIVVRDGRIASLLELGIGFHPELSGRENIFIKASTFGFSKKEIDSRIDSIIEFAELGDYIDEPIRIYSTGMNARLAFAIAINVDADIIIADEIFSVGDLPFREKCTNVFRKMRKNGATIIIVSHGLGTIMEMCNNAIWLRDGKIYDYGICKKVCDHYENEEGESFKATLKSAESGDSSAQNKLAVMYRDGKGTEVNHSMAIKWFKKSAETGNREAQRNLGDMISKGLGVEPNQKEALSWFILSAESGDVVAINRVANIYRNGIGIDVDRKKAFKWFKESAETGNGASQFLLAEMLMDGDGTNPDSDAALKWYLKSAESGNSNARYKLGVIYRDGQGAERNINEAIKCFNLAVAQGNVDAQIALMDMISSADADQLNDLNIEDGLNLATKQLRLLAETGNIIAQKNIAGRMLSGTGMEQDSCGALKWYLRAANAGDAGARHQVGTMYRWGIGTHVNPNEAFKWFKLAAGQKNVSAIIDMARMLLDGDQIEQDKKYAFDLFKTAADLGNAVARNHVGTMCRDGIGTEVNVDLAKEYLSLSSEQGNNIARLNLADILIKNNNLCDMEPAFHLYHKAALSGNPVACYQLGIMYRDGLAMAQDISKAISWLEIAAKKKYVPAVSELNKLISRFD